MERCRGHILRLLAGALVPLLLLSAAVYAAVTPAGRVALIIGNGEYRQFATLANPLNDAEAVSEKLRALDFQVLELFDADRETLVAAVRDFGQASREADISLIFYAGHGIQVAGRNYLIPVDATLRSTEDLPRATYPVAEIYEAFAEAAPRLGVLILDACRDNPFAKSLSLPGGLAAGEGDAAEAEARKTGMLIAYAAAPGAVAADGADGNSPFTTALLQWIDRPDLEIGMMFRRVRETVLELTYGIQVPWVEESVVGEHYLARSDGPPQPEPALGDLLAKSIDDLPTPEEREAGEIYLARLETADQAVVRQGPAIEQPSSEADQQAALTWLSIRDEREPELFEAFVASYPDSAFTETARARLTAPEPAEEPDPVLDLREWSVAEAEKAPADAAAAEAPPSLSDAERRAVQLLLSEAGHYRGSADGKFGPGTRGAIEAFRAAARLPAGPDVDRPLIAALVAEAGVAALRRPPPDDLADAIHRLAAIARHGPGAEPERLRVATFQRRAPIAAEWQAVADEFERSNPGMQVEFQLRPNEEYKQTLLAMLGSAAPPDIFYTFGGGHLRALAEAGFARDLTDEMGEGWALDYKPPALSNLSLGDRVYAVPAHLFVVRLWVNRELLRKAGLAPEDLRRWEDLPAAIERLKAEGIVPIAAGGAEGWPIQFYWGSLAQRIGGPAAIRGAMSGTDPDGLGGAGLRGGAELLGELGRLEPFQPGYLDATDAEAAELFGRGGAAMILTGNWNINRIVSAWPGGKERADAELGSLDFPSVEGRGGETTGTYGGMGGWAVNARSSDRAVELARRLSGIAVQTRLARLEDIPAVVAADGNIADARLRELAGVISASPYHQLYLDQEFGPEVGELVNRLAVDVASGRIAPAEAAEGVSRAWAAQRLGSEPRP